MTLPDAKQPVLIIGDKKLWLRDISEEGLALWMPPPAPFGLTPGSKVRGDILVGQDIHPVELEVSYDENKLVGFKILHRSKALAKLLHELLEPCQDAARLKFHKLSGQLDPVVGQPRLWAQVAGSAELLVWYHEDSRMILGVQLVWQGQWVYREPWKTPQTGVFTEANFKLEGKKFHGHELLQVDKTPNQDRLLQASQFLSALYQPIPGHVLWLFLETGEQVFLPPEKASDAA